MGQSTWGATTSNMPAHNARIAQIMSHLCAAAQEAGSSDVVNEPGFSGSYAGDYKIRDLSLHERGRKELLMAEVEMPGLMNCRKEWGTTKPLSGARVMGSLHDRANCRPNGDIARDGSGRALGHLQHLLHSGRSCCSLCSRQDCMRVRMEGPIDRRVLGVHGRYHHMERWRRYGHHC